jgi:hypothetical protein
MSCTVPAFFETLAETFQLQVVVDVVTKEGTANQLPISLIPGHGGKAVSLAYQRAHDGAMVSIRALQDVEEAVASMAPGSDQVRIVIGVPSTAPSTKVAPAVALPMAPAGTTTTTRAAKAASKAANLATKASAPETRVSARKPTAPSRIPGLLALLGAGALVTAAVMLGTRRVGLHPVTALATRAAAWVQRLQRGG